MYNPIGGNSIVKFENSIFLQLLTIYKRTRRKLISIINNTIRHLLFQQHSNDSLNRLYNIIDIDFESLLSSIHREKSVGILPYKRLESNLIST